MVKRTLFISNYYDDDIKEWCIKCSNLCWEYFIFHRLNGPAIEYTNKNPLWYYKGHLICCTSQEEFIRTLKLKALW